MYFAFAPRRSTRTAAVAARAALTRTPATSGRSTRGVRFGNAEVESYSIGTRASSRTKAVGVFPIVPSAPKILMPSSYTEAREIGTSLSANRVQFGRAETKIYVPSESVAHLTPVVKVRSINKGLDGNYWRTPAGPRCRGAPVRLSDSEE